jgi:hypothetical protein
MDVTTARTRGPATAQFEDGLGRRHHADGDNGEPLEILALRDELVAAPGFKEEALRDQVARLATFRHASFGHVRKVARLTTREGGIAITSDRITGLRLSEVMDAAEKRQSLLDMRTALWLTGQLVSAVAALHERGPEAFHGAIAPERIVITPDARLVVVEHVLGAAVSQLWLQPSQYWKRYRIALPPALRGAAFDRRTDVMQIGAVALALVLGHALGNDFPEHIGGTAAGTATLSAEAALELLPDDVRSWLSPALQCDSEKSFASAIEARDEFDRLLKGIVPLGASDAFKAFMAAHVAPPQEAAPPETALRWPERLRAAAGSERTRPTTDHDESLESEQEASVPRRIIFGRQRVIAAVIILVLIASVSTFAARRYMRAPVVAPSTTGRLVVNTNPPGIMIAIDGEPRGTSPLRLELASGDHVVDVLSDSGRRTIPVTVTAGSEVAHFIDMPQAVTSAGQLQIRTEPSGARVIVDGEPRGLSPATIDGLAPGVHKVTIEGALGSVSEEVTVQAGAVASLVVPLNGPSGVPVSGWIGVAAPAEVQLYENGRLLGSSRTDRIMALAGKHDLEIANDALGFRVTRSVTVTPGRVTTLALDWPAGSMALNALPWADVWIDGQRIGETPVGNLTLPIGPHEVVFRHPELGEQRFDAIVTLKGPARLSADLRKK